MITLETGFVIGGLLASFTMCMVKIIQQLENSRCTKINNCCGTSCERDMTADVEGVEVNEPQIPVASVPLERQLPPARSRPTIQDLRSRFE
jgi:hypothetical protein